MEATITRASLTSLQSIVLAVGRILIALLFVPAGWAKLTGFSTIVGYIASKGVPFPTVCAVAAIAIELGLGLALIAGWKARWAALGLALFVLVITPIFHNFWSVPDAQVMTQRLFFYKNLAVLGGLAYVAIFGAGAFSLDERTER